MRWKFWKKKYDPTVKVRFRDMRGSNKIIRLDFPDMPEYSEWFKENQLFITIVSVDYDKWEDFNIG